MTGSAEVAGGAGVTGSASISGVKSRRSHRESQRGWRKGTARVSSAERRLQPAREFAGGARVARRRGVTGSAEVAAAQAFSGLSHGVVAESHGETGGKERRMFRPPSDGCSRRRDGRRGLFCSFRKESTLSRWERVLFSFAMGPALPPCSPLRTSPYSVMLLES